MFKIKGLHESFRIKKRLFPSCNSLSCALQHDFLRRKKIFHIVKYGRPPKRGRKKTGA